VAKFSNKRLRGIQEGYRSGLEVDTANYLKKRKISFTYEKTKIKWIDLRNRTYTPDFVLGNGIIVETKGRFVSDDRRKHKEIKKQFPNHDIRFVFTNSRSRLYKGSKTTYGDWCTKHGFIYADKIIPESWLEESNND